MATKIEIRNYATRNNINTAEAKAHFKNLAENKTNFDILLRLYPDVGLDEAECGTIRIRLSKGDIKSAKAATAHCSKDDLSQALAFVCKECDYDGDKILKSEYNNKFGAMLAAYISTYNSFQMMGMFDGTISFMMDHYGKAPHRGLNRFEFVLRYAISGNNDFDAFESTRAAMCSPKY
tara:strand:+ start:127 stop:660 length:534 start_codon:yes stop_codon:yes gene_type:complete